MGICRDLVHRWAVPPSSLMIEDTCSQEWGRWDHIFLLSPLHWKWRFSLWIYDFTPSLRVCCYREALHGLTLKAPGIYLLASQASESTLPPALWRASTGSNHGDGTQRTLTCLSHTEAAKAQIGRRKLASRLEPHKHNNLVWCWVYTNNFSIQTDVFTNSVLFSQCVCQSYDLPKKKLLSTASSFQVNVMFELNLETAWAGFSEDYLYF